MGTLIGSFNLNYDYGNVKYGTVEIRHAKTHYLSPLRRHLSSETYLCDHLLSVHSVSSHKR